MSAAAIIHVRVKRVFAYLRDQGALSPESAVPESDVPYHGKWYVRRLVSRGVVRKNGDRWYLDEESARRYLRDRWIRAVIFICIALLAYWL